MKKELKFSDSIRHYEDVAGEVAAEFLHSEWNPPERMTRDHPGSDGYYEHYWNGDGDPEVTLTVTDDDLDLVFLALDHIQTGLFYEHDSGDNLRFMTSEPDVISEGNRVVSVRFSIIDIVEVRR